MDAKGRVGGGKLRPYGGRAERVAGVLDERARHLAMDALPSEENQELAT